MRKTGWTFVALGLLPAAVLAADNAMQPGMWEYQMKMEMPGMPMQMPPQTFQHCMTKQDVDKGEYGRNPRDKSDCKVANMKRDPGKVSYDVVCTGEHAGKGHFDFTMTPTTLTGGGTMDMEGHSMKQTFSAKRVGDCK